MRRATHFSIHFRAPALLRTMVRAGKLGKKTGEGFYRWKDGVPEAK